MHDKANQFYRAADRDAYQDNPLVIGYEIKLSATAKPNTNCELCRTLAGEYPVWFVWKGWHDGCICFKIPILMPEELFNTYQRLVAHGKDTKDTVKELQSGYRINTLPDGFKTWADHAIKDQQGFENAASFITNNFENYKYLKLLINR